jgi:hypothetical protein
VPAAAAAPVIKQIPQDSKEEEYEKIYQDRHQGQSVGNHPEHLGKKADRKAAPRHYG